MILVHFVAKHILFHPSLLFYYFGCQCDISYRYKSVITTIPLINSLIVNIEYTYKTMGENQMNKWYEIMISNKMLHLYFDTISKPLSLKL